MTATTGYPSDRSGLLLVGPYNDLLSEDGIQREMLSAAHDLNGPTFAHAIVKSDELLAGLGAAG